MIRFILAILDFLVACPICERRVCLECLGSAAEPRSYRRCHDCHELAITPATPRLEWRNDHSATCTCLACYAERAGDAASAETRAAAKGGA